MKNNYIYIPTALASLGLVLKASAAAAAAGAPVETLDGHFLTISTVAGLIVTVVMLTRRWTRVVTKIEILSNDVKALKKLMASRPCVTPGETCPMESETENEKPSE